MEKESKRKKPEHVFGITQADLAEKASVTTAFVGQIERGEKKLSLKTLANIANVLNVSIDSILRYNVGTNPGSAVQELLSLSRTRPVQDIIMLVDPAKVLFDNLERIDEMADVPMHLTISVLYTIFGSDHLVLI